MRGLALSTSVLEGFFYAKFLINEPSLLNEQAFFLGISSKVSLNL